MHREWRRKSDERNWLERIAVSIFSLQPRNDDKVIADQRLSVHSILEEWNKAGRSAGASTCENSNLWLNAISHCTKVVATNWKEEVTILCHIVHKQATQLNIVFPKASVDGLLAFFLDAVQSGIINKRVLLAIASVLYGNRNEISDQRRIALFGERGLIANLMEHELQRNNGEHDVAELEYAAAQCCYCAIKTNVIDPTRSQPKNVVVGRDEREALQICDRTFARTVCAIVTDGGERQYAADSLRRKTLLICLNGLGELQSAFNWQLTAEPAPLCSALCALVCFPNQLAESGPDCQQGSPARANKSTNASESEPDSQIEPLTSGCDSPADRSEADLRSGSSSDQKRSNDRPNSRVAVDSGSRLPSDGERSRESASGWKRSRRVVVAARTANWQDTLAQSRLRSSTLLSQIVKSVNERSKLSGIWSVFFSVSPSLKHAESAPYYAQLLRVVSRPTDNELRVRLNLIATLCSLLDKAKWCWLPARDEPQLRSNYAFIPYSVQLATILRELHRKLFELIATEKRGTDHTLLVQLVKCLAALIGVTPFDKLRPSTSTGGYSTLAGRIVAECTTLLDRRDANLKVAVLECFSALQKAKLSIAELQSAFDSAPQPQSRFRRLSNASSTSANATSSSSTWLIDTACALVFNVNEPGDVHDSMPVRIEALRLLGMISQYRFEMLKAAVCFAKLSELADAVLSVRNVDTQTRDLQVSTVRLLQQVVCAVQLANEQEGESDLLALNFVSQLLERCVLRFLASPTAHVLVRSQLFQLVSALNSESVWTNVASQTREKLLELTLAELEVGARVGAKNSCAADALCAASAFLSCSVFLSADVDAASYRMPRGASLLQAVLTNTERLVENPDWSSAGWQSVLKLTEALLRLSEALSRKVSLIQLTAAHYSSMLRAPLTVFAREREPLNANRKSSDKILLNLARCLVNLIALLRLPDQTATTDDPHVIQLQYQISTVLRFARERMSDPSLKLAVRAPCCSLHLAVLNNDFLTVLLSVNTVSDRRSHLHELRHEYECLSDVLCDMFATECAGATAGSESFLNGVLEACIACRSDTQKRLLYGSDKRRFSILFGSALKLLLAARELSSTLASTRPMTDDNDRPKDSGCLLTRTLRCLLLLARSLDLSDLSASEWSAELASGPLAATSDDRVSPSTLDALSRVAEQHGDDYLSCCKHLTALLEIFPQNAASSRLAIERLILLLSI